MRRKSEEQTCCRRRMDAATWVIIGTIGAAVILLLWLPLRKHWNTEEP